MFLVNAIFASGFFQSEDIRKYVPPVRSIAILRTYVDETVRDFFLPAVICNSFNCITDPYFYPILSQDR